jgi:hypothetical protein
MVLRRFAPFLRWTFLFALTPLSVIAATKAGNVFYSIPAGWTATQNQDGETLLLPPGLNPGEACVIALPAGREVTGDFRKWFLQQWSQLDAGQRVVDGGQIQPSRHNLGFDVLATLAELQDKNGRHSWLFFYAAHPGSRAEVVLFITNRRDLLVRYQKTLADFLVSLHYANLEPGYVPPEDNSPSSSTTGRQTPPPATQAQAPPSKGVPSHVPEKVYLGYHLSGVVFNTNITKLFLLLYPDGWAIRDFPSDGLDTFNLQNYMRDPDNKAFVGRYRSSGNHVDVLWEDAPDDRSSFELDETAAVAHFMGGPLIRLCRCNGATFSGVYDAGRGATIQFSTDGTFVDRGAINAAIGIDLDNPWRPGQGTYAVQNYTITLIYRDGRHLKKGFLAPAAQEKSQLFNWMAIANVTLEQHHKTSE